jgi:5-methylcytosine-specific restriction protein A
LKLHRSVAGRPIEEVIEASLHHLDIWVTATLPAALELHRRRCHSSEELRPRLRGRGASPRQRRHTACQIRRGLASHSSTYAGTGAIRYRWQEHREKPAMPSFEHFRMALRAQLLRAQKRGLSHIDIKAGDLHRLGGSPAHPHPIPSCCEAMYAEKRAGDVIITRPPEGKGATLTIRYKLPRKADA